MAYALRFYKELTLADGKVVRLEIFEKDGVQPAMEIGPVCQALRLDIQGDTEIDAPIVKTSVTMTFVDAPDHAEAGVKKCGNWAELYTADATKWRVVINAKKSGKFMPFWGGYLTPDSFTETLIYRGSVTLVARDNIGHMQDFPFDAVGSTDGMISLRELLQAGWAKIESPMSVILLSSDWMQTEGVSALDTVMNVSAFEGKNWLEVIESVLFAYGATLRYVGNNEVAIRPLRYIPNGGNAVAEDLTKVVPVFMSGAERELVPAVRRVEETCDYDVESALSEHVKQGDFTGASEDVWILGETDNMVGIVNPITRKTSGNGWCNPSDSLFFNPAPYNFLDEKDEGEKQYTWLTCNTADSRFAEYSRIAKAENLVASFRFGATYGLGVPERLYPDAKLQSCDLRIMTEQNGITKYLNEEGEWTTSYATITKDLKESTEFELQIPLAEYQGAVMLKVQILKVQTSAMHQNKASYVPLYHLSLSSNKPMLEKNAVNTAYNAENNVILSREPKVAPALNTVSFTTFIKNGIFRQNGAEYFPTKGWGWEGDTPQQMAVYNHLQLLCYHAKPNNVLRGTIINADISNHLAVYEWRGAEHMLVSGSLNLMNGYIENAVLREFARYEDMWGVLAPSEFPDVEGKSSTNADGRVSGGKGTTYNATTNVNIGGSGGSITLDTYMSDTSENGVQNRVIKAYVDGEVNDIMTLLATMWRIEGGQLVTDKDVRINANLIVEGDAASGGSGQETEAEGTVTSVKVGNVVYDDVQGGVLDMTQAFANLQPQVDLSAYLKISDAESTYQKIISASNKLPYSHISGTPTLATVATSGSYNDLSNKPTIPSKTSQITEETNLYFTNARAVAAVLGSSAIGSTSAYPYWDGTKWQTKTLGSFAFISSLAFSSLTNKPTTVSGYGITDMENQTVFAATKLISGTTEVVTTEANNINVLGRITVKTGVDSKLIFNNTDGEKYTAITFQENGTNYNEWLATGTYTSLGSLPVMINSGATSYRFAVGGTSYFSNDMRIDGDVTINGNLIVSGDSATGDGGQDTVDYLPLSGGKISSSAFGALEIERKSGAHASAIKFSNIVDGLLGYIGIGGSGSTQGKVPFFEDGTNEYHLIHSGNIKNYYAGGLQTSAGADAVVVNSSGNVSLNGTHLYAKNYIFVNSGGDGIYFGYDAISWHDADNNWVKDIVVFNSSGNVGIGTINPAFNLDVSGKFRATGNVIIGSSSYEDGRLRVVGQSGATNVLVVANYDGYTKFCVLNNGNATLAGTLTQGSDIRFKSKLADYSLSLESMAYAPLFTFYWTNRGDNQTHIGTSAQYWEMVANPLVSGTDFKGLDYSTLGVAMGISLARKALDHESRIKALEDKIKDIA